MAVFVSVGGIVPVGRTICVGATANKALTVNTAAVLKSLNFGSSVTNAFTSKAVGGVASKNAMAYSIHTRPIQIVIANNACNGTANSRSLTIPAILSSTDTLMKRCRKFLRKFIDRQP